MTAEGAEMWAYGSGLSFFLGLLELLMLVGVGLEGEAWVFQKSILCIVKRERADKGNGCQRRVGTKEV